MLTKIPDNWYPYKNPHAKPTGDAPAWSGGGFPPPELGAKVKAWQGKGHVRGYFVQEGFLGVVVFLDEPADWWLRQNGRLRHARLFGSEIVVTS